MSEPPTRPELSVVIPTRNRGALLQHAVASCLAMRSTRFEVVVVDNESTDNTGDVLAASRSDTRLRVVTTTPRLSQVDNWDAAVDAAHGRWVVLLGDDDALVPSFFDRLCAAIGSHRSAQVISWQPAYYTHRCWRDPSEHNRLDVRSFTGQTTWRSSSEELRRVTRRRESASMPKIGNNAAFHRDVLDDVTDVFGRVFLPPIPDYSFGTAALALGQRHLFIDQPLSIVGKADSSAGFSVDQRNPDSERFLGGFERARLTPHTPLSTPAISNLVAEAILTARETVLARRPVEVPDLDWARYFVTTRFDLDDTGRLTDVRAEVREWRRTMRTQPLGLRISVALLRARRRLARNSALHRVRDAMVRVRPGASVRHSQFNHPLSTFGGVAGFDDIAGAASFLESSILRDVPLPQESRDPEFRASAAG